ncbi:MAG TPA: SMC family ATPase [Acidimicrobiia bacterium]|nr:SMC family ATPase [Acidimicrobiia bacterium]
MRPVTLELSGFGAFREATTVDFDGADFFALVGPTGSGKSTIIDAICFALYGTIPRYDDRRLIAPIVSTGALEAKVSLTFAVGGEQYVAARVVRLAKSGAPKSDGRLERVRDGEVLAGRVSEMEDAVLRVLGLPFAHFTKCVVLPQGDFARFLHDKPADRQQLLVELLNLGVYTEMGQEARALAARREAEIGLDGPRLDALVEQGSDARKGTITAQLGACTKLGRDLQDARAEVERLTKIVDDAERDAERAQRLLGLLRAVEVPSDVARLAEQQRTAAEAVTAATQTAAEAQKVVQRDSEAFAKLPDLAVLLAARGAHHDLAALAREVEQQQAAQTKADARVGELGTALAAAEEARDAALATQEDLRTEHRAHMVAATLHAGDPCPVCGQTVSTVPKRRAPAAITKADAAVKRAQEQHAKAAPALEQARVVAEASRRARDSLAARERELTIRVAEHPDASKLAELIERIETARTTLDAARAADDAARREVDGARGRVDALAGRGKEAAAQLRARREPILQVGAAPPEPHDDLLADWEALAAWAEAESEATEARAHDAQAATDAAQAERRARLTALVEACGGLGVAVGAPVTLDALADVVVRAQRDAEHELAAVKAAATEAKKLRKVLASAQEEAAVAKQLGQLLRASEFERWLVSEAFGLLVEDASSTLRELTNGQYSLAFDETSRDFLVVDHRNADERRSVRTLSGGETFQASLALALALSDQLRQLATDGAAQLESIFLDEGFGSLDPETLETVASTIETLAVGDRMVGLVTHVAELSERVPTRFVVRKDARTATVEKVLT